MFSRIIKYLVIRTRRYSAYDLNDMRLHAIGLYAGQDTSVEEPEEADGSSEGSIEYLINNPSPEAAENQASLEDLMVSILFG
jgi:hypothetical protein